MHTIYATIWQYMLTHTPSFCNSCWVNWNSKGVLCVRVCFFPPFGRVRWQNAVFKQFEHISALYAFHSFTHLFLFTMFEFSFMKYFIWFLRLEVNALFNCEMILKLAIKAWHPCMPKFMNNFTIITLTLFGRKISKFQMDGISFDGRMWSHMFNMQVPFLI